MDITQSLKDAENSLRDFVATILEKEKGSDWINKCGVSSSRIDHWKERKQIEESRQTAGTVEERLLYYADFYDLKTILKKNWSGELSTALGDWKTMEVLLGELEKLRDTDAHRRELLPHQNNLILGISGEIRNKIIRYRSKQETSEDVYPRFESVRDNLGHIWIPKSIGHILETKKCLRVGDTLEFVASATDPMEANLDYGIRALGGSSKGIITWQQSNILTFTMTIEDIRKKLDMQIFLRSPRKYHAFKDYDAGVAFRYEVLPPKQ